MTGVPGEHSTSRLLGRRAESAALGAVVEEARSGRSAVLVVRGEPGVGKSVLLDHVVDRASGCRVARAGGVESEMELPLAGLQQLVGAWMLERIDHLPPPQQEALRLAFGLSEGPPPDRFLLGLAALSLLSDAAEKRPLVCVIDDVQWLDRESAQVLSFVARRLEAEPVAMVFAVREPSRRAGARRAAGARGRRSGRRGCAGAARVGDPRRSGRTGSRSDRGRDPGQSARTPRAAARIDRDRVGGRVRTAGRPRAARADRAELSAPSRHASGRHTTAAARCGGGTGWRSAADLARGRAARRGCRGAPPPPRMPGC